MLSVTVSTSVSKLSLSLPRLAAVMLKLSAVMSTAASPSSTAPAALRVTLWPVAVKLPTVKSPALTPTVTAPAAVTWVKRVAPAEFKLNKPVLALMTVKSLSSLRFAAPVMLSVRLSTEVSRLSVLVPKLRS